MDHFIYTAMNGAKQVMQQQATNANNIANVSTPGFRADLDVFNHKALVGPGHQTRAYPEDVRAGIDLSSGQTITTGRALDASIQGRGFFAIQDDDGQEYLSRRGDFRVSPSGLLENGIGQAIMGNGGPIAIPPHDKIEIGSDGTISILPKGQATAVMAVIDRIKLVNPDESKIKKETNGLISTDEELVADADVQVLPGSIESSNVNAIGSMVKMIELARSFEMQVKVLKRAEENDQAASNLTKLS